VKQHLQIKSLPCCNSFLFFSLVFFTFFCNFFIQQGSATQNLRTNGIRMWPVEQKLWYEARQTQACRNFGGRKLDLPSRFLQKQFRRFSAVSENVYFCPIPSWNEKVTAVLLSTPRNRVSAAAEETNVVWTTWYGWMVVETQTLRRWTNFNQQLNTTTEDENSTKQTENEYCGTNGYVTAELFFGFFWTPVMKNKLI